MVPGTAPRPCHRGIRPWKAFGVSAAVAVLTFWPGRAAAQGGGWPTLAESGVEYVSASGFFQVSLSGQLDLEPMHVADAWTGLVEHPSGEQPLPDADIRCARCHVGQALPGEGGSVLSHRLRLFADIFLGDQIYSLVEVRNDRGHAPFDGGTETRVEQAYVRFSVTDASAGLQLGRFASPFGSYPQRHLTIADPFLRPPLAYDYRTVMSRTLMPVPSRVLTWKDEVQFFRKPGAPPIWDVPYQWGALLFGSFGPLDLRLAAMNSAPSSEPDAWDFSWEGVDHPSVVAGARVRATAFLDLGASYSRGPWMEEPIAGTIDPPPDSPPGTPAPSYRSFDQELVSVDLSVSQGPAIFRLEAIRDRWEIPNVADHPEERIYSAELMYDLRAGLTLAGRVGYMDFQDLEDGVGGEAPWDYDVYRWELSAGYRFARNAGILVSGYRQIQETAADGDTHLIGARLWWAF